MNLVSVHHGDERDDIVIRFHSLDWENDELIESRGYEDARSMSIESADEVLTDLLLAIVDARKEREEVAPPVPLIDALVTFCDQFNLAVVLRDPGPAEKFATALAAGDDPDVALDSILQHR